MNITLLKLTRPKARILAMIFANFSAVFLGSLIIPIFVAFDISRLPVVLFGLLTTVVSIWWALLFAEKGRL